MLLYAKASKKKKKKVGLKWFMQMCFLPLASENSLQSGFVLLALTRGLGNAPD